MVSSLPNYFRRQQSEYRSFLFSPFRSSKSTDLTALLSLPVLAAFALFASPARALPAASLQLFRLDGQGMKPMPAVSALLNATSQSQRPAAASGDVAPQAFTEPQRQGQGQIFIPPVAAERQGSSSNPSVLAVSTLSTTTRTKISQDAALSPSRDNEGASLQLIAQADGSLSDPKVLDVKQGLKVEVNPQGGQLTASLDPNSLTLRFNTPIPTDLQGAITVRFINPDDTLGETQQLISDYTVSPDGLGVTLRPGSNLPAGTNFAFEFPGTCAQGPCVYPGQPVGQPLYVGFNSPQVIGPAVVAGAAAATFPVWAVVLGVVVVGVGVAAASGAFSSGGGGGGTNPSSQ